MSDWQTTDLDKFILLTAVSPSFHSTSLTCFKDGKQEFSSLNFITTGAQLVSDDLDRSRA